MSVPEIGVKVIVTLDVSQTVTSLIVKSKIGSGITVTLILAFFTQPTRSVTKAE